MIDPIYIQLAITLARLYMHAADELDSKTREELRETLNALNDQLKSQPDLQRKRG